MVSAATIARYSSDNGPIVFGVAGDPPLDVRWNPRSKICIVEIRDNPDAAWVWTGGEAEQIIVGLAAAHARGKLHLTIKNLLSPQLTAHAWWDTMNRWYRCGGFLLERPARHDP